MWGLTTACEHAPLGTIPRGDLMIRTCGPMQAAPILLPLHSGQLESWSLAIRLCLRDWVQSFKVKGRKSKVEGQDKNGEVPSLTLDFRPSNLRPLFRPVVDLVSCCYRYPTGGADLATVETSKCRDV
jgi:hypothetical protein